MYRIIPIASGVGIEEHMAKSSCFLYRKYAQRLIASALFDSLLASGCVCVENHPPHKISYPASIGIFPHCTPALAKGTSADYPIRTLRF